MNIRRPAWMQASQVWLVPWGSGNTSLQQSGTDKMAQEPNVHVHIFVTLYLIWNPNQQNNIIHKKKKKKITAKCLQNQN